MPNVFQLWGELRVDSAGFENSLYKAEVRLGQTEKAIADTEKRARDLGKTNNVTARTYEKLTDTIKDQRTRMNEAIAA